VLGGGNGWELRGGKGHLTDAESKGQCQGAKGEMTVGGTVGYSVKLTQRKLLDSLNQGDILANNFCVQKPTQNIRIKKETKNLTSRGGKGLLKLQRGTVGLPVENKEKLFNERKLLWRL